MAHVSTGATGFGGFLGGLADLASAAAPIVSQFVGPRTVAAAPVALPGGAISAGGVDLPGLQIPFTGQTLSIGPNTMALLGSPFRPTMAGAASKTFVLPNPVSGKATWFRPAGRPILWSGDLTTCKRVKRIARRARRSGGSQLVVGLVARADELAGRRRSADVHAPYPSTRIGTGASRPSSSPRADASRRQLAAVRFGREAGCEVDHGARGALGRNLRDSSRCHHSSGASVVPTPEQFFSLIGVPIPQGAVGSAVPKPAPEDRPQAATACPQVVQCRCKPQLDLDPDLVEELLELRLDRLLFEEDC